MILRPNKSVGMFMAARDQGWVYGKENLKETIKFHWWQTHSVWNVSSVMFGSEGLKYCTEINLYIQLTFHIHDSWNCLFQLRQFVYPRNTFEILARVFNHSTEIGTDNLDIIMDHFQSHFSSSGFLDLCVELSSDISLTVVDPDLRFRISSLWAATDVRRFQLDKMVDWFVQICYSSLVGY